MKSKCLIYIFALILFTSVSSYALDPYSNTLDVTGPLYCGGHLSHFTFHLTEPAYDHVSADPDEIIEQRAVDKATTCPDCIAIGDPSSLVNCAGYVINKLFNNVGIGPTKGHAPEVLAFCKKYGHELGMTDSLQKNDIVVYGDAKHVAIVTSGALHVVELRTIPATIQGKDNAHTIFRYTPGQDGTWNKFGVKYYRIEPNTLSILRKSAKLGLWVW